MGIFLKVLTGVVVITGFLAVLTVQTMMFF